MPCAADRAETRRLFYYLNMLFSSVSHDLSSTFNEASSDGREDRWTALFFYGTTLERVRLCALFGRELWSSA